MTPVLVIMAFGAGFVIGRYWPGIKKKVFSVMVDVKAEVKDD